MSRRPPPSMLIPVCALNLIANVDLVVGHENKRPEVTKKKTSEL